MQSFRLVTAPVLCASVLIACGRVAAPTSPTPSAPTDAPAAATVAMFPALIRTIESLAPQLDEIPAERRKALDRIAAFVASHRAEGTPARLTFICTGNSRRSHLGQLWAAAAARYNGIDGVETYSGGTEPSAFNPRTIAALERAGFDVAAPSEAGDNPHYAVSYAQSVAPIESFSKRYDDASNPRTDFVAVMTCSEADRECPFVPGAALRISLPYEDPKVADDTPEEAARYDERSRQIGAEMLYLFSEVDRT